MIAYILGKPHRLFIILTLLMVGAFTFYLLWFGNLLSRYTVYFFVAPFILLILFATKDPVYKLSAPLFLLIFLDGTIISRIPLLSVPFRGELATFFPISISLIFMGIVLFSFLYNKPKRELPPFIGLNLALFLLTAVISLMIGSEGGIGSLASNVKSFIMFYLEFFIFFYAGYLAFNNNEEINRFAYILVLFGLLAAMGHLFSLSTGIQIGSLYGQELIDPDLDLQGQYGWRYGAFFHNVNSMSAFYVMLIPVALIKLFNSNSYFTKMIFIISIAAMVLSAVFGGSRAGLLFIALNCLLVPLFLNIGIRGTIKGFFVFAILGAVLLFLIEGMFSFYFERSIEYLSSEGFDSPRWIIWPATISIIFDHPLGVGLSSHNFSRYLNLYAGLDWGNPHSVYLELATQTGIAGLILFVVFSFRIFFTGLVRFFKSIDSDLKNNIAVNLVVISGFLLMGISEPIFRNGDKLNHFFGLILGIATYLIFKLARENNKDVDDVSDLQFSGDEINIKPDNHLSQTNKI